ncbi:hypothetical protein [Kordiimonas lacus]|uniref:LPS sulfotransferase NodH n=1 Tax=Kordiimonas lacus TaxID=637679 RepID=A0A1G7F8M1_9PROT|nr:hypothetical protein [Kordiimonas lacus]SDE72204.1 LPS sulfotransferase NodH [Kordiimonas lacus]
MKPQSKVRLERFVRQSRAWTWPPLFRGLRENALVVMDGDILRAFDKQIDGFQCQTATPNTVDAAIIKSVKRIFVLCREGELALVRRLRRAYPRKRIFSCTYDIAPKSLFERPKLMQQPEADKAEKKQPILIVGAPYSDAEFLAEIIRLNGFGNPMEYLDRALGAWLAEQKDFQIARYMDALDKLYRQDGVFDMVLHTDVMKALFENSRASWKTLLEWIRRNDARVIYFTRRDKMAQAGIAGSLDGSRFRSVWNMTDTQRKNFNPPTLGFAQSNAWLQDVLTQEALLEDFLRDEVEDFRSVTLEELVEQPVEVLKALAMFLGEKSPKAFSVPDYRAPYQAMPQLWADAVKFRHELIDRLGLHVNAAGSLVTYTDDLIKGDKKTAS